MTTTPILIVDDNATNLKLMRVLLSGEGFAVHTSASAQGALQTLQGFKPSLILMDVQMPDMDGLELTKRLKADSSTSGIPVVAITAYAMSGDEQRALSAGCDAYVTKPIDTRALPDLLRRIVAKGGSQ